MAVHLSSPIIVVVLCLYTADAGVSYIRWGRTVCPSGAQVLYKGYMAGSGFKEGGNGANLLCIPDTPQFVRGTPEFQGMTAKLTGVEFANSGVGLFLTDNVADGKLAYKDMSCVRCYVESSSDVMMIPGRQDCYETGYTLQYKGFLVAETSWHLGNVPRREYVCLDEAPEAGAESPIGEEEAEIYPVELQCGVLPCPPYVNGMEATCAVCSK